MLVFIYCWLTERTKYFFAVFFLFCSRTQKKNVAEPQKNLNLGPKIIIIFSFKIFFVRFLKEQQILPAHHSNLQSSADCTPSACSTHPSCPSPLCPQPTVTSPGLTSCSRHAQDVWPQQDPLPCPAQGAQSHLSTCYLDQEKSSKIQALAGTYQLSGQKVNMEHTWMINQITGLV